MGGNNSMKKYLRFLFMGRSLGVGLLLTFFCLTLNNSASAYTKKDLENLQLGSAIAELVLSVPFLLDRENTQELLIFPFPAIVLERLTCCALETNTNFISDFTIFVRNLKQHPKELYAQEFVLSLIRFVTLTLTRNYIKSSWPDYQERTHRRVVRTIASALIIGILGNGSAKKLGFVGDFLTALIVMSLGECIGEQIIQGAEEGSSAPDIYSKIQKRKFKNKKKVQKSAN